MGWAEVILTALKLIAKLLGLYQSEQDKQAGRDEVLKANVEAEAKVQATIADVEREGTSDAKTLDDLRSGRF